MNNELLLFDRTEIIKTTNDKYDLEHNAYLSFSGGKDSTLLHYLLDMALPNNLIPRVFIDTGIEYNAIKEFVYKLAQKDKRIVIIKNHKPIKQILEKYGYPFKSKQHSHNLAVYQNSGIGKSIERYLGIIESTTKFRCPKSLMFQFSENYDIKISDKCCLKLKKEPIRKWEKENNRFIAITGMRNAEGGERASIKNCILTDKNGNITKFHPLLVVDDEFEDWLITKYNIKLCDLYYFPYNFKRTGCKGCPFSLDLQEQLEVMEKYLPNERLQCEAIWKPIYQEYRKLNYRLSNIEKVKLL